MIKSILTIVLIYLSNILYSQSEVTITIGYPDHEDYFIYSIPPQDEHARFGGEYYFKVENTGSVDLVDFEINTLWKALNSTWGVVEKTVINSITGEIKLTGPSWDSDLNVGESFVLNGEWIPSSSVEDWIEFLPRETSMTANGSSVSIVYDVQGQVNLSNYSVQKVIPFNADRKTFSNLKTVAYFPIFDAENAWCSLQRYGSNIDELRVQLYSIDDSGTLRAGQDLPAGIDPIANLDYWLDSIDNLGVLDYCVNNGIELIPVVYNYNNTINDFDQLAVHYMMTTSSVRAAHLNDLEQLLVSHPEFDGIDVDYESLMATDRDNYSAFMEDLSAIVHSHNKILTTAVHTKAGPGTWYGPQAQDYQRIGNAVDEMLLMTYDLHWATSPTYNDPPPTAGCQSTSDWMNDVAAFAVSEIDDPSKIQLGLPFYGYRWKYLFENHTLNDAGVGLTAQDAQELIDSYNVAPSSIYRDPNGNEPHFIIDINGTNWICYYQDGASIETKLESLNEHDLRDYIGGIGIWRLGGETDAMWDAVTQAVNNSNAAVNTNFDCTTNSGTNTINAAENLAFNVDIHPNPVQDILYVQTYENNDVTVQLFDLSGKEINDFGRFFSNEFSLDVNQIPAGFYLLKISASEGQITSLPIVID